DIDIDLSNAWYPLCEPMLAGIYFGNSTALLERTGIFHARVPGRPDCDSGVGVLVESGPAGVVNHETVNGKARVMLRDMHFEDYQKAGFVGLGSGTVARVEDGDATTTPAPAGAAVPYGYELGLGATGKVIRVTASGHATATDGL